MAACDGGIRLRGWVTREHGVAVTMVRRASEWHVWALLLLYGLALWSVGYFLGLLQHVPHDHQDQGLWLLKQTHLLGGNEPSEPVRTSQPHRSPHKPDPGKANGHADRTRAEHQQDQDRQRQERRARQEARKKTRRQRKKTTQSTAKTDPSPPVPPDGGSAVEKKLQRRVPITQTTQTTTAKHRFRKSTNERESHYEQPVLPKTKLGGRSWVTPWDAIEHLQPTIRKCNQSDSEERKKQTDRLKLCDDDPNVAYAEHLQYPAWVIPMAPTWTTKEKDLILGAAQVKLYMETHDGRKCRDDLCHGGAKFDPKEHLVFHKGEWNEGMLVVVRDGVYRGKPDSSFSFNTECEWLLDYNVIAPRDDGDLAPAKDVDRAALLFGPQDFSFQHYIDRAMPDTAQAAHFLAEHPDFKVYTNRGEPSNSEKASNTNLLYARTVTYLRDEAKKKHPDGPSLAFAGRTSLVNKRTRELLFTCRVPRYHPYIWRQMQVIFGAENDMAWDLPQRNKIVYLPRTGSRKVTNNQQVIDELQAIAAKLNEEKTVRKQGDIELVVFKHQDWPGLDKIKDLFNTQALAVVGAHGGAFYNINWAAAGTVVIEFFPTRPNRAIRYPEGTWWQSLSLRHRYWMMPCLAEGGGNVSPDVTIIRSILLDQLPRDPHEPHLRGLEVSGA